MIIKNEIEFDERYFLLVRGSTLAGLAVTFILVPRILSGAIHIKALRACATYFQNT